MSKTKKIAIVHDWLPLIGGAERVLEHMLKVYPDADVYTLFNFLSDEQIRELGIKKLHVSYLNNLPGVKKYYRKLLPLCPGAIESFDLSPYDLVLSSSHACAKGVITGAHQRHVSYVHSPARYVWDLMHDYLRQTNMHKGPKGFIARYLLGRFRLWDYRTANGVDYYIANSDFIRKRIWKVYRREAEVIYPPVDIERFPFKGEKEDYFITASRMVPYKRIDLIVEAFKAMPDLKLKVLGAGPEMDKIAAIAKDAPNIELLGYLSSSTLREYMQNAKAFVFAAEEDFGIIPVEAQACGTPIIAYAAGGALETVIGFDNDPDKATGVFFDEQTAPSIKTAVRRFEEVQAQIRPENCRANAEKFAPSVFQEKLKHAVEKAA